jgi:hypothetical protein
MCASVYTANTVSNMKSMYCGVWRRRGGTKIVYMYVTAAYLCVCDVGMTLLLFFSYYNLMSTKYVLPVWSSSSCSFYKLFYSTDFSLSLSLSSFQHLVPLWKGKKYYYYSSFITSLIPFSQLSEYNNHRLSHLLLCYIYFSWREKSSSISFTL